MPDLSPLSLLELVPALRPDWRSPYHLADWCALMESSLNPPGGEMRALCAIPFQHHKTTTTLIGIVWLMLKNPKLRILYVTHSHEKAQLESANLRELLVLAGQKMRPAFNRLDHWETEAGGGCTTMSIDQSRLGSAIDIVIVDDPMTEETYKQKELRDKADEKIGLYTARVTPHLNVVLLVSSRWSRDDPFGRRERRGWKVVSQPGIIGFTMPPEGVDMLEHLKATGAKAFAHEVMSLEKHVKNRREWQDTDPSNKRWWAQIQNEPMPEDAGGFGNPVRYSKAPDYGRYVIGIDLAYSDKAWADYFALVVLKIWEGKAYVLNVLREKRDLEAAAHRIMLARRMYPGAAVFTYYSGPEKGALEYLESRGLPVTGLQARTPKYNRAQRTKDAWNAGAILIPEHAPWAEAHITRAQQFTGREDAGDDDDMDALVSAMDGGFFGAGPVPTALAPRRIGRY